MKVILINDLSNGGAENVVTGIVNRNKLVLVKVWPEKFYNIEPDIVVHTLLKKKGFIFLDLIKAIFLLVFFVNKNKVKAINSHLFWSNYINVIASFFSRHEALCTHCVSLKSKYAKNLVLFGFHFLACKFLLNKAALNIYKSFDMKSEYQNYFNIKNGTVIYNPIDICKINSLVEGKSDLVFESGKIYLLVVGRFHKTKKQEVIIETLRELPEQYEVIFLGDGHTKAHCENLAIRLGLSKRVHFLGRVKNPYPFYARCNYYISCSEAEGFPNALIEAIYLDCYPIHFDSETGPKEILSLGYKETPVSVNNEVLLYDLGIIFTSNTSKTLSYAIKMTSSKEMAICGYKRSHLLEMITIDVIDNKYVEVLS